ncbi:MAG: MerR family transcriptional regulator [Mycobacterium sp.]
MKSREYRLDELARMSGVSARNIRAYRERGLLDPPRREGRSAFYDGYHLAQLQTVNELLRRGFTSAHIAEFFETVRAGGSVAELLGLGRAILRPRTEPGDTTSAPPDRGGTGDARLRLALLDASRDTVEALADDVMAVLELEAAARFGSAAPRGDIGDTRRWIADGADFGHDVVADRLKRALRSRLAAAVSEGRAASTAD